MKRHILDRVAEVLSFLGVAHEQGTPDRPIKVKNTSGITEIFERDAARQLRKYENFIQHIPTIIRDD
jgi:hypothetical protein